MFDAVVTAVRFVTVVRAEPVKRVLERLRFVDEERARRDVVAVPKLAKGLPHDSLIRGQIGPNVKELVRLASDSCGGPITLIVRPNHGLTDCEKLRTAAGASWSSVSWSVERA